MYSFTKSGVFLGENSFMRSKDMNLFKEGESCKPSSSLPHFAGFSLRILLVGESCNVTGEYFERGFMSE